MWQIIPYASLMLLVPTLTSVFSFSWHSGALPASRRSEPKRPPPTPVLDAVGDAAFKDTEPSIAWLGDEREPAEMQG